MFIIPLSVYGDIPDIAYKDHAYSMKTYYYDLKNDLKNGITTAEKALSAASFENSEAKKKIDGAWGIRSMAWVSNGKIESNLGQTEESLSNKHYKNSYDKLLQIDKNAYSLKDNLYATLKEIKNAQGLEKKYQESKKTCILFWCYGDTDTYSKVDSNIQDLESKLKIIESKLVQIKSEKNNVIQSIQKYEITQKDLQLKKSETLRKQEKYKADQELRDQKYKDELARKRLEEQNQKENQRLLDQNNIEIEKQDIIKEAEWSPLIRGLIKGQLNYYVNELPSYSSSDVKSSVESLASFMDGKTPQGVRLNRVYSSDSADLTFDWAKDYQEGAIGRQIGKYLLIGLGTNGCDGSWKPFNANTVYKIMWHEMGHAMGFAHSKDSTNIMYELGTGNDFSIDYDKTINLKDGYAISIPFCDGAGQYSYEIESDSKYTGFSVYAVPPTIHFQDIVDGHPDKIYPCDGGKGFTRFSSTCSVEDGAYLYIENPLDTIVTSMNIHVKIYDLTDESPKNMEWDSSYQYFPSEHLDYVRNLFR